MALTFLGLGFLFLVPVVGLALAAIYSSRGMLTFLRSSSRAPGLKCPNLHGSTDETSVAQQQRLLYVSAHTDLGIRFDGDITEETTTLLSSM